MKQRNFETGRLGEKMAGEFLTKKGYQILERNFRTRFGEIDLIVTKNNVLVFVEVKLKIGEDFGTPEEMIDKKKLWQVEKTAQRFLIENPSYEKKYESFQFDAVCVVLDESREVKRISHYENIGL
jgi:putative endonuclease